MEYIVTANNSSLILEYYRTISDKTQLLEGEIRRLKYFTFHVERCNKVIDTVKLTLMASATAIFISAIIQSIAKDTKELKVLIFPTVKSTREPLLLEEGKPNLNT